MGNDVITDFDAVGGGLKQDYLIPLADDGLHWEKSGKNVLPIFDNGTTITLLGVKYSDIGFEDFTGA